MGRKVLGGLIAIAGAFVLAKLERDASDAMAERSLAALSDEAAFLARLYAATLDMEYGGGAGALLDDVVRASGRNVDRISADRPLTTAVLKAQDRMYSYMLTTWSKDGVLGYAIAGMGDVADFSITRQSVAAPVVIAPAGYGGKVRRSPSELLAEAFASRAGLPSPAFSARAA